jgi:LmbE family N-acetylglucosaminyl deacetylase
VVIAAPHPDDEVLGCAGIMAWLDRNGVAVEIVAVTDGDASHARSSRISAAELVARRMTERTAALERLGLTRLPVHRLGLPDSAVADHERTLVDALASHVDPDTTLLVPCEDDGHPDHEAVARAGIRAAQVRGSVCLQVPIWARVRSSRPPPLFVLELDDFRAVKAAAVREFRSQLVPLGPDAVDGPVVHPHEVERMTTGTEWVVAPG